MKWIHLAAALGLLFGLGAATVTAQNMDDVEIRTIPLTNGIYMLMGAGGNIGVSAGDDGVYIIDDQFAPLTEKILAAIAAFSDKPVRFVLNTHWHGDHVGGNENLGKTGAVIIAHENVRKRMSVDQFMKAFNREVPAAPAVALPVITFSDGVTLHLNGLTTKVFHVADAHTDGDSIIHFTEANVIHMGDTYFNGRFPFIDIASGGSIDGVIAAAEIGLGIANDETRIIPGHGDLSNAGELAEYRDMLKIVRSRIAEAVANGVSQEDFVASKPLADLHDDWGGADGAARLLSLVYGDVAGKAQ